MNAQQVHESGGQRTFVLVFRGDDEEVMSGRAGSLVSIGSRPRRSPRLAPSDRWFSGIST